jgi:hypothetical protein
MMSGCKAILPFLFAATVFGDPLFERMRELPTGHVGRKYAAVLTARFSGQCSIQGVNWQIAAGDLPEGVTLRSGRLEGTPTATGGWEIALRASTACSDLIVPIRLTISEPNGSQVAAASKNHRAAEGL